MVVLVIVVGVVTAGVLTATLLILFRHIRLLADSLSKLQSELVPVLEEIRSDSELAQTRIERLGQRRAALQRDRG